MKRIAINKILVAVGMAVCATGQIYALPLIPGGTVLTPTFTSAPGGSPIVTDPVTNTTGTLNDGYNWKTGVAARNKAAGNYLSAVYVDPVSHQLDFYYQIQNTFSSSANNQNTLNFTFDITDFTGFAITDVEQVSGHAFAQFSGSTPRTIKSVSRSLSGSTVTVNLTGTVRPGQNSSILLLKTNALNFQQGTSTFKFLNPPVGCAANTPLGCGNAYAQPFFLNNLDPILAPEPGFYGMLSVGIGGLLFAVRRRRSVKA